MKQQFWSRLVLAVSVTVATLSAGCANKNETQIAEAETSPPAPSIAIDQEPVQKVPPAIPAFTEGVSDVVKLAQANVEESIVISYVENSPVAYDPTSDEILYLNDIGVSSKVITAMIHRGRELRENPATPNIAPSNTMAANELPTPLAPQLILTNGLHALGNVTNPAVQILAREAKASVAPTPISVAAEPPEAPNEFYESLSPYGSWMQVPDYGWVWQPSIETINTDWQPYCDGGHWLYSDSGWYWMSDYSWGWAPFHYGRWFRHANLGWLWVPDSVWGPAWVCWRQTPLYCGWAPLPPAALYEYGRGFVYYGATVGSDCDFGLGWNQFVFIHYQHFCSPYPRRHRIDGPQAHDLYGHSHLNNRYILGPNHAIINEGVDRQKVTEFSRVELRKVNIRDLPPAAGRSVKPDRVERNGNGLVIYKPEPQYHAPVYTGPVPRVLTASIDEKTEERTERKDVPLTNTRTPSSRGNEGTTQHHSSDIHFEPRMTSTTPSAQALNPNPMPINRNGQVTRPNSATRSETLQDRRVVESEKTVAPASPNGRRLSVSDRRLPANSAGSIDASTPNNNRPVNNGIPARSSRFGSDSISSAPRNDTGAGNNLPTRNNPVRETHVQDTFRSQPTTHSAPAASAPSRSGGDSYSAPRTATPPPSAPSAPPSSSSRNDSSRSTPSSTSTDSKHK